LPPWFSDPQSPQIQRSSVRGVPQFDLGPRTDVLSGCTKAEGMRMLLMTMSPEILAADEKRRISGMWEYLTLAAHFGDYQYGREVDGQTWRVIREKELFEAWSNRVVVSHAFLRRMLEFGRKNNFTDDAGVSAERYCIAVKELRRFSDSGQSEYAAVLKPCVEKLGDELDREDSVLKKGYDYYRSFCPTDEDAKPMLKEIIRKMGRRPKWAKKED